MTSEGNGTQMYMPVAPAYGGGNGFGMGGDWGSWIILFLIFGMFGGWGNGNGNGYGGVGGMYPWLNQSNQINDGFRDQMINDNVTSIRDGVFGIQNQLCSGFAGVNATVNGAQNAITQQMYTNQIADMQQNFAMQQAFANCCCENRLGVANLGSDIAREACATRTSDTQNTQMVLNAINDGFRQMSDQRYQDKIDAKNDEIAQLRQEVLFARGQSSQVTQNGQIIDGIYNRLATCPVGTVPVYGEQNIFTCGNNNAGCGCGNF